MSELIPARSATTLPTHAPTIAPDNGRESWGLPWGQSDYLAVACSSRRQDRHATANGGSGATRTTLNDPGRTIVDMHRGVLIVNESGHSYDSAKQKPEAHAHARSGSPRRPPRNIGSITGSRYNAQLRSILTDHAALLPDSRKMGKEDYRRTSHENLTF